MLLPECCRHESNNLLFSCQLFLTPHYVHTFLIKIAEFLFSIFWNIKIQTCFPCKKYYTINSLNHWLVFSWPFTLIFSGNSMKGSAAGTSMLKLYWQQHNARNTVNDMCIHCIKNIYHEKRNILKVKHFLTYISTVKSLKWK